MWATIRQAYEGLVMMIIRPLRATYAVEELGPTQLQLREVVTKRVDLQLKNQGGFTLECSWWKPETQPAEYASFFFSRMQIWQEPETHAAL